MLAKSGLANQDKTRLEPDSDGADLGSLQGRIKQILKIFKTEPVKAVEMLAIIMYDIENNKVRALIAKYLKEKGCIRIQKSVYIAKMPRKLYQEINQTLKEIQEIYENKDSIIMMPIPTNSPGSMNIIGKDIQISSLIDKPNALFF